MGSYPQTQSELPWTLLVPEAIDTFCAALSRMCLKRALAKERAAAPPARAGCGCGENWQRPRPDRGGGLALTGLLGGQVHILFSTMTQMLPNIRDGRLRGLAVTSAARSKLAPDIPTMVESGFDQFIVTSISAIVAPPDTPIDIRRRLNEAVATALASEEVQRSLSRMGGEARPASPEDLASYLAQEQQRWSRIVETTKVSVD